MYCTYRSPHNCSILSPDRERPIDYSAVAYYRRGLVYKDTRKYDLAIADFREVAALTKDPALVKTVMEEIQYFGG